jgi:cardiolipin synthase
VGNAVGAAITDHRTLGPAEAKALSSGALILLALALVAVLWPRVITIPLALFGVWMAAALLARVYKLRRDSANSR